MFGAVSRRISRYIWIRFQRNTSRGVIVLFEKEIQTIFRRVRPGLMGVNGNPTRNLALVIEELKANPKWLEQIQKHALEFLSQQNYVTALTESGLMVGSGFITEILRKIGIQVFAKGNGRQRFSSVS